MGLEGIEKIEVVAAELAAEVFGARYAEIRVGSGALANLYVFMMAAKPGDVIIAPPPAPIPAPRQFSFRQSVPPWPLRCWTERRTAAPTPRPWLRPRPRWPKRW